MTTTLLTPMTISGTLESHRKAWCMYEHHVPSRPGEPPMHIYTGACLLRDVFAAPDAKRNTEWIKLVNPELTPVMLVITAIGTISEMLNARAIATRDKPTHCNRYGRDLSTTNRVLKCSNGQTYHSQQHAADELGLNQSQLSKHLRRLPGHKSIKGYTFSYEDE